MEDKIIELLESNNYDDNFLGAILAAQELGQTWCEKNMISGKFPIKDPINKKIDTCCWVIADTWHIILGSSYIEYRSNEKDNPRSDKGYMERGDKIIEV